MNKEEKNEIQALKCKHGVYRFNDCDATSIALLILNRGEQLFYQENDKAFICEISARHRIVFTKSIKKWDDGKKIDSEEKKRICSRMTKFYKKAYQDDVAFTSD